QPPGIVMWLLLKLQVRLATLALLGFENAEHSWATALSQPPLPFHPVLANKISKPLPTVLTVTYVRYVPDIFFCIEGQSRWPNLTVAVISQRHHCCVLVVLENPFPGGCADRITRRVVLFFPDFHDVSNA